MKSNGEHPEPKKSLGDIFEDLLKADFDGLPGEPISPTGSQPTILPANKPWVCQPVRGFVGHTTPVWSVAVWGESALSASGWRSDKGTHDCTVRLWNLNSGAEVLTLQGHHDHVRAVAFSPDGKFAASASDDRTIRHWDLHAGRQVARLPLPNAIKCLAFSPRGNWLISGGDDKVVRFSTPDGKVLAGFGGHTDTILAVGVSPDGSMVASSGEDRTVRLWDVVKGIEVLQYRHNTFVGALAFSRDGKHLLSGSADETVLFDLRERRELRRFDRPARAVAFSPVADVFLLSSGSHVDLCQIGAEHPVEQYFTGQIMSLAFCPDGKRFLTAVYKDKTLQLWDMPPG